MRSISYANRWLGLYEEGIERAKEALEIYERLNDVFGQGQVLRELAWLLYHDEQLDAVEEAALRAINLLSGTDDQYEVCGCRRLLGNVHHSKGDTEKAIDQFETAIRIASTFGWHQALFWNNYNLAGLFFDEGRSDEAHIHIQRAKSYTINDQYQLGRAMELQANFCYEEGKSEEAKSEALRAAEVYERIGAAKDAERCKTILRDIEQRMRRPVAPRESGFDGIGELLDTTLLPTPVNSSFLA